jgi:hypothetical protein
MTRPRLGIGIGWRPEIDLTVERLPGVDFVEVLAENVRPDPLPESLTVLRAHGVPVIAHAVSLSLGGAEPVDRTRIAHLATVAEAVDAPLVSEHVAFTRAGGLDAHRLDVEARSLRSTRRSVAARLRPDLAEALGDRFRPLFDSWAIDHPKPAGSSFRTDLDRFEASLYAGGHLEPPRAPRRWFRRPTS